MITQEYTLGEHQIKIESVESIEDAREQKCAEGEFTRYYINGKKVENYMAMIRFIVDESQKNNARLIPSGEKITELRKQLFQNQSKALNEQIEKIKTQYKNMNVPQDVLLQIDEYLTKLDPVTNLRVVK